MAVPIARCIGGEGEAALHSMEGVANGLKQVSPRPAMRHASFVFVARRNEGATQWRPALKCYFFSLERTA